MGGDRSTARCEDYSPQSSSASGARASATGAVSFTSSSAPQSGQDTISPLTASEPMVTSASHSGHFDTFPSSQELREGSLTNQSASAATARRVVRARALSSYIRASAVLMSASASRPSTGNHEMPNDARGSSLEWPAHM